MPEYGNDHVYRRITLNAANAFFCNLPSNLPSPALWLDSDGDAMLTWRGGKHAAVVSFHSTDADIAIAWQHESERGAESYKWSMEAIPDAIIDHIEMVSQHMTVQNEAEGKAS